jgi:hypothetical protein
MAIYYVRSTDGSDSDNGSTWALAKATITGALNIATSGDIIYVSQAHSYTNASSAITYPTPKGTITAPIQVICVNDSAMPPTQLSNTAIEHATTTNGINFQNSSYIYWYGITFKSYGSITLPMYCFQVFDTCGLQLTNTSGNYYWYAVNANNNYNYHINFINTNFISGSATFSFQIGNTGSGPYSLSHTYLFKGCTVTGTAPSNFFNFSSAGMYVTISTIGCDFSLLGASSYLFYNHSNCMLGSKFHLQNCKLNSAMTLYNNVITSIKLPEIILENCDSDATNYHNEWHMYQGTIKHTIQVMKTGGASSGLVGFSWELATNARASSSYPLESPWLHMWCGTTGTQRTVAVSFVHDSQSSLGSGDFWAEFEYRNSTNTSKTTILSTIPAAYPLMRNTMTYDVETDAAWLTTGMTYPKCQRVQFQFIPPITGLVFMKFYLAKSNYTVYIDPVITLT